MSLSLQDRVALLPEQDRREWLASLSDDLIAEILRGDWWWVARPEQIPPDGDWFVCLALAGRGWGKAIDVCTPIASSSDGITFGFKPLGDLRVGDFVLDEQGKPAKVTAVYDQLPETAYRVQFSDGAYLDACGEHQWVTWEHRDRRAYLRSQYEADVSRFPVDWVTWRPMKRHKDNPPYRDEAGPGPRVRTTQAIVDTLTHGKRGDTNHCIPVAGELKLPAKALPVDPWVLGYWLGNGTAADSAVTTHGEDFQFVLTCVTEAGYTYRITEEVGDSGLNRGSFRIDSFRGVLSACDLLNNKHVPKQYLWASVDQRRALLAGLMDSDGYIEEAANYAEFCSTDRGLADAVMHLARSLGQKPSMYEDRATIYGVGHGPKYRVCWRPTFNPFRSPRKSAGYHVPEGPGLRNYHRMITSAESITPVPMRCITVDSPNHMYLAGEALIPTHNSRSGSEWIVDRILRNPFDRNGIATEWLVIAETLSDARTICMEGPAGILNVLERRKLKYRYKMSPRPMVVFEDGAKIYSEGADDPDVGRGYNASGAWLDEMCVAENEPVLTLRGRVPVQGVLVGDLVMTRAGWRSVTETRMTKPSAEVLEIVTTAGSVRVTPDHRVWTERGWVMAQDVVPHDIMWQCSSSRMSPPFRAKRPRTARLHVGTRTAAVRTRTPVIAVNKVLDRVPVYDITVSGEHPEFAAGSGQLLIHNCKWKTPKRSWYEGILPSLRADLVADHPRAFVTTTPKPIDILQEWVERQGDGTVHVIRGSTFDNARNLSPLVIEELKRRYEGTAIGAQELYGEILTAFEGALFSRLDMENYRLDQPPDDIVATVVGVDPSLTGEDDEMGIVVVSRDSQKHMYILADRSTMAVGRTAAREAWRVVAEYGADKLVVEENLGKRWMQQVFNDAYFEMVGEGVFPQHTQPPMVRVDSKLGKRTRGEPVAMRSEQGRLHLIGHMKALEDQMATFTAWGARESPDRLDALVHACRFLMDGEKKEARIASPTEALSTTLQDLLRASSSYHYG